MIKFFRKIRQRLLSENRFSKYLVYAIGEILLVVIGILIALQINNWSEENKTDNRQSNYLELIKNEMSNNLDALKFEKQRLNEALIGMRELVALCDRPSAEITEKEFSSSWTKVFSKTIRFRHEDGAMKELISSGVLNDINNDHIRNTLAAWEGMIEKVIIQEQEVNSYIQKGNNYLERHGSVRTIIDDNNGNGWWQIDKSPRPDSNKSLLDSQEFENILVFAIGTGQALHDYQYNKLEEEIESMIDKIDLDLQQ